MFRGGLSPACTNCRLSNREATPRTLSVFAHRMGAVYHEKTNVVKRAGMRYTRFNCMRAANEPPCVKRGVFLRTRAYVNPT